MTTNYDDWFLSQWNTQWNLHRSGERGPVWREMQLCGRSDADCERVMSSLRAPDNPLLWALQGFIGGFHPNSRHFGSEEVGQLIGELVVGHEEYRRVAHRSPGFRRAFSEVFRSRSLLFIGSGLQEAYFRNLFDEVLELQGSLPLGHFAFVLKDNVNVRFLRERYQIEVLEYDSHEQGNAWIKRLREEIEKPHPRAAMWGIEFDGVEKQGSIAGPDLQVAWRKLPNPTQDECLLVSAGLGGDLEGTIPFFSRPAREAMEDYFDLTEEDLFDAKLIRRTPKIWRFGEHPSFAAAARRNTTGSDDGDARVVFEAMQAALEEVERAGFHTIYSTLLATGSRNFFPSHISLMQMVRAYAQSSRKVRLVICVLDPWCIHLLASSRLNLNELVSTGEIRFWVQITRPDGAVVRYLEFASPNTLLANILKEYDLDQGDWDAFVLPSPSKQEKKLNGQQIMGPSARRRTVASVGLVAGSTLRIEFPRSEDQA